MSACTNTHASSDDVFVVITCNAHPMVVVSKKKWKERDRMAVASTLQGVHSPGWAAGIHISPARWVSSSQYPARINRNTRVGCNTHPVHGPNSSKVLPAPHVRQTRTKRMVQKKVQMKSSIISQNIPYPTHTSQRR